MGEELASGRRVRSESEPSTIHCCAGGDLVTAEEQTLQVIRNAISEMPKDEQARIETFATTLRYMVKAGGACGSIALALVGAEMAAE